MASSNPMQEMKLKQAFIDALMIDIDLQVKISKATLKSIETVKRWGRDNHKNLTIPAVQEIIRTHLKLAKNETLLAEQNLVAA